VRSVSSSSPAMPCLMCRRSPCPPVSGGRSSTSVRAPGRVARRGHSQAALELMTALHNGAPIATFHRDAPARCGAFADERRVVGGDDGGRESLSQPRQAVRLRRQYALRCAAANGPSLRCSIRFARPEFERIALASQRPAHRHLCCAAPVRCGAVTDEPFQKPPCTLRLEALTC